MVTRVLQPLCGAGFSVTSSKVTKPITGYKSYSPWLGRVSQNARLKKNSQGTNRHPGESTLHCFAVMSALDTPPEP